jgi:hypothetical protein
MIKTVEVQLANNLELPDSEYRDRAIALSLLDARFHFSDYPPFANWLKKTGFPITPDQARTLMVKYYDDRRK